MEVRKPVTLSQGHDCRAPKREATYLQCSFPVRLFIYNIIYIYILCVSERLLTFQSAFRDVLSSQNVSAMFTNVGSVGAVSTATGELVVRQSRSYSVSTATKRAGWAAKEDAEGWSIGLQLHRRTAKNGENLTDCVNRVDATREGAEGWSEGLHSATQERGEE